MLVFIYIGICIAIIFGVIISHFFLDLYMKRYDGKVAGYQEYWLAFFQNAKKEGTWHLTQREEKILKRPQAMEAFYRISNQIERGDLDFFVVVNKDAMVSIGKALRNKMLDAYYAFVLSNLFLGGVLVDGYRDLLFYYLQNDRSIYCRENCLKALYSMGDAQGISEAFLYLSEKGIYHSEKLLTDGLCEFHGDYESLFKTLMKEYSQFEECYRIAILNSLSRRNVHTFDCYFRCYLSGDMSVDERCSCLRLLGKKSSEHNMQMLIRNLEEYRDSEQWEPAAVAAGFLGNYSDETALRALERAMRSPNWYVRMNAARALVHTNHPLEYIRNIILGNDQYAKDALRYVIMN